MACVGVIASASAVDAGARRALRRWPLTFGGVSASLGCGLSLGPACARSPVALGQDGPGRLAAGRLAALGAPRAWAAVSHLAGR
eukprot:15459133-Alexandrium_andersonii.AAC.1